MPTGSRPNPPTRACRLTTGGVFDDANFSNVLWFYFTGEGEITVATLTEFTEDVQAAWCFGLSPLLDDDVHWQYAHSVLQGPDDEQIEAWATTAYDGAVSGDGLPANIAACVTWHIEAHYRGGHPRSYICGIPQAAQLHAKSFEPSFTADLQDAMNTFHTAAEGLGPYDGIASVEHGTISFVNDGDWRDPPIFRRYVRNPTVDSRIDSQRRRLGPDVA